MRAINNGHYRHKVTASNGAELSRQFLYMPDELWEALRRLCVAQNRPGSKVIQSLVAMAAASLPEGQNASRTSIKQ